MKEIRQTGGKKIWWYFGNRRQSWGRHWKSSICSHWSWNQCMWTEPKSWRSSMSQHPQSQFLVGSSVSGCCQPWCKFSISSFEAGFPFIPNGLVQFSSLRPSYCPQQKGKYCSLRIYLGIKHFVGCYNKWWVKRRKTPAIPMSLMLSVTLLREAVPWMLSSYFPMGKLHPSEQHRSWFSLGQLRSSCNPMAISLLYLSGAAQSELCGL